jgi:hypothetical protein
LVAARQRGQGRPGEETPEAEGPTVTVASPWRQLIAVACAWVLWYHRYGVTHSSDGSEYRDIGAWDRVVTAEEQAACDEMAKTYALGKYDRMGRSGLRAVLTGSVVSFYRGERKLVELAYSCWPDTVDPSKSPARTQPTLPIPQGPPPGAG